MSIATKRAYLKVLAGGGGTFMKHIKMFRAALAALVTALAGGYAQAEDAAVEDTPAVDETPAVTKVKCLKPKYTSVMTVSGYTGESELENFPVAVRISTANIPGFDYAKCDGEGDVTFTDNDGNILPHEIEVWNTEGESVAWVSIPKLSTVVAEDKTTYTTFKMHWGHETKLADTKATEVWTGANYLGVFHMNTPLDATATTQYQKNSSLGPDLTMVGASPSLLTATATAGKVLKNVYGKTSAGDILTFPNINQNGINQNGFVLSGWSYWSGYNRQGAGYLCYVNNPLNGSYHWQVYVRSNKHSLKFGTGGAQTSGGTVNSGWFHWAVVVRNAKDFEYYTNGAKIWSGTKAGNGNDLQYIKGATSLKYQVGGTAGYTDEIRILNIAPSEEYIKAEYDSINNKQFVVASEAVKNGYGLKIIVR